MSHEGPWGRFTPRWSTPPAPADANEAAQTALSPASIAGDPVRSACVSVDPGEFRARGPRTALGTSTSCWAVLNPHELPRLSALSWDAGASRLWPSSLGDAPEQFCAVLSARMV